MPDSNILTNSRFWYSFIISIIFILFVWGMSIEFVKSDYQKTKTTLKNTTKQFEDCSFDLVLKNKKIKELEDHTLDQKIKIIELENQNQILQDSVYVLSTKPPEVITKYIERIVYKDTPNPFHEFGKGNGKLVIYTTCKDGGNTSVWVDGEYIGILNRYQVSTVNCNSSGTISKLVSSGIHLITAKDEAKRTWDGYVTIKEDNCHTYGLTCN